jgi:glutaryl-CoA dehydrogenase
MLDSKLEELYQQDIGRDVYSGSDFYAIDDWLNTEHLQIRDSVRDWVKNRVSPIIEHCAQENIFPKHLVKEMGKMGVFGPMIPEKDGGSGADHFTYGIMMQEIERGDSGIRSTASVQGSLVMYPISKFGSDEQKKRFIPKLATGEYLGSFGLTEPDHGSNPSGMTTHFVEEGDHIILNGSKTWISNAPACDVAIVWAKGPDEKVYGVIVERGMKGFSTPEIKGKWSLRASTTGELVLQDVRVPKSNILPHVKGMKGPLSCLNSARFGIAWGAIGAAIDCYETAKKYALERQQFDRPIASFQLQQKKLSEALTEITKAQLLAYKLAEMMDNGSATPAQISMAKRNNVDIALNIARECRQILGGNGVSGDFPIMRHMNNLESVITYEGTHDVHLLILGMDITGINAFT